MSRRIALPLLAAAAGFAAFLAWPSAPASGADDLPASREALVELGRRLFFDPAIGRQGRIGCSSCHDPEHGFSDPRARSVDEAATLPRHSQPVTDLEGSGFHWDGEFDTVRDLIDSRILPASLATKATAERALAHLRVAATDEDERPSREAVNGVLTRINAGRPPYYGPAAGDPAVTPSISDRIAGDGRYAPGLRAAFGSADVTPARIGDALEAYIATLRSTTSPFDRFLAGDETAIPPAARRGRDLFVGRAGCAQCHTSEGPRPAFTDGRFHNTGVEASRAKRELTRGGAAPLDPGRLAASFRYADEQTYKTPGLRDVARRAPYFHDASAATLADVVRYYEKVPEPFGNRDARVRPLNLTDGDVADLVAFLESLTGTERAGLGRPTALRSPRLTVRVECLDGSPVKGLTVSVRPFGDRLAPASALPGLVNAVTDDRGLAVVDMPASTHVVVTAPGIGPTAPLPDWTADVRLVFTPRDTIALTVRFATESPAFPDRIALTSDGTPPLGPTIEGVAEAADRVYVLVRELGPSEALYAWSPARNAPGESPGFENRVAIVSPGPEHGLELRAGALARLDLRAHADVADPAVRDQTQSLARTLSELASARYRAP